MSEIIKIRKREGERSSISSALRFYCDSLHATTMPQHRSVVDMRALLVTFSVPGVTPQSVIGSAGMKSTSLITEIK